MEQEKIVSSSPMFVDVHSDQEVTELDSWCPNCEKQGRTRLLLTRIPFFREVIIMAFECPYCDYRNNEIQPAASIAEKGCRYQLKVTRKEDLNRTVVKSDSATFRIEELDFEIPANTQKGLLNTIEGFIQQSMEGLSQDQEERRKQDPEVAKKVDSFLEKLEECMNGSRPFTVIVDDPAGNSFIQNPFAPSKDPHLTITHYKRTPEQNEALGLTSDVTPSDEALKELQEKENPLPAEVEKFDYKKEAVTFIGNCNSCSVPCETKMVVIDIPYFKEAVIMATSCDNCGYRNSEVKAGGPISPKGKKITLQVTNEEDMSRSVLKSETATLIIPEIDIFLTTGSMGGKFTTLEGLLISVKEELERNPFTRGDSGEERVREKFKNILAKIDELSTGTIPFTLIIEDPLANSYVQNIYAPDPDPNMIIEEFERTWEQNEGLGLNDIKTENY